MNNRRMPRSMAAALLGPALFLSACSGPAPREEPPLKGASIGGPIALTDQNGRAVTDAEWKGKHRIIYFGYSYCPDVCPVDLQKLMRGLIAFEKAHPGRGGPVVPVFISIDPERDTPATLKPFVERYHPRLIGLTGTPEQIAKTARQFAVIFQKQKGARADAYLMGHSQLAYLFGPNGEPLALLPLDDPNTPDVDEGAPDAVAKELDRWIA